MDRSTKDVSRRAFLKAGAGGALSLAGVPAFAQ
jgi:hypothetical protein